MNECLAAIMVYHVSNRFLKKKIELTSEVWVFLTLGYFLGSKFLCQSSLVELYYWLIDLNQD